MQKTKNYVRLDAQQTKETIMKFITIFFALTVITSQLIANPSYTRVISPNKIIAQANTCDSHRTCAIIPADNNYLGTIEAGPRMDTENIAYFKVDEKSSYFTGYRLVSSTEERNLFYTTPLYNDYPIDEFLITNPFKDKVLVVTVTMQQKPNQGVVFVFKAILDPMTTMTLPVNSNNRIRPHQLFVRTNVQINLRKILFLR